VKETYREAREETSTFESAIHTSDSHRASDSSHKKDEIVGATSVLASSLREGAT
jgi:hypothetical protein